MLMQHHQSVSSLSLTAWMPTGRAESRPPPSPPFIAAGLLGACVGSPCRTARTCMHEPAAFQEHGRASSVSISSLYSHDTAHTHCERQTPFHPMPQ